MSNQQTTKEAEVIDSTVENLLGIEFRKDFYDNNTIKYFVNNNEVSAFSAQIVGKNKRELIVSIVAKADE